MPRKKTHLSRRAILGTGAAGAALLPAFAAAQGRTPPATGASSAFTRTDEGALRADDASLSERARQLVRIGEDGITRENPAAMEAFFHRDFRFHGPGGAELNREELWAYFAACRAAFDDFTVTRQMIVSDGLDHLATRTRFAGLFVRPFTAAPDGAIQPNGKPFEYRIINIFRYATDGRLAEEWVQYDPEAFLRQLRA